MEKTASVINSKRVLKNTIFLYIRMFVMMLISLFTVRIALRELGVTDYGIYNVVGSVVALCSFVTGSLTAASNRFFAREMVNGTQESFRKCFSLNLEVFGLLIVIAIVLLETIGLWYVNTKMVIPTDRLFAANVIYQLSILVLCLTFFSIPYNAIVIIHEEMSLYAYVSIIESLVRLGIAFALVYTLYDKLIVYGVLMAVATGFVTLFYYAYCKKKHPECHFSLYWNKDEFKELFTFVGWYFFGSISAVFKSQGINLIINLFFNPAINAARAVAFQVESAIRKFSDGYFTAVKPQIYKAYANFEFTGLNRMITRTTIICGFLMSFFALPIFFNAYPILNIWLNQVPEKAVIFLQLTLIDSVLNTLSEPVILTIVASGRQKLYQTIEFTLRVLTLPTAYILLKCGYEPESTIIVCVFFSLISVFVRASMLKRCFKDFNIGQYIVASMKILLSTILIYFIVHYLIAGIQSKYIYFLFSCALSVLLLGVFYYLVVLPKTERTLLNTFIIQKINHR